MPPKAAAKSSAPSKGGKGKAGNNTLRVILGVMAVVCAGVAYVAFLPDAQVRKTDVDFKSHPLIIPSTCESIDEYLYNSDIKARYDACKHSANHQ